MLLPPLGYALRLVSCVCRSLVFVPPTFHNGLLLAAGLFRVEHQSPFMSLGNAAVVTCPNSLSSKSSQVVGRATSTLLPQCAYQQSANPYVAMVVFSCSWESVFSDPLQDCDAD
jgi:hypothetical protein